MAQHSRRHTCLQQTLLEKSEQGHEAVVQVLLEAGADVDAKGKVRTALHACTRHAAVVCASYRH